MDRLFLRIIWLGQTAQKHYHNGDVLIGLSEVWGIVPPIHGVALDPIGITSGAARWSLCMGRSVVR